jgi:hypothetical protein
VNLFRTQPGFTLLTGIAPYGCVFVVAIGAIIYRRRRAKSAQHARLPNSLDEQATSDGVEHPTQNGGDDDERTQLTASI